MTVCDNMKKDRCPRQKFIQDELMIADKVIPCKKSCCVGCIDNCAYMCGCAEQIKKERKLKMSEKKELDNKQYIVDRLLATEREGMEDLVAYMEEISFFEAPCSGGNHLSCKYGLVHHTRNVMELAEKVGLALMGAEEYNKTHDSVMIAAALHDLGKCGQFGKQYYVPNMIKDGRQTKANPEQKYKLSEDKPFQINKDLLKVDHCIRSITLATLYIDLTEEEQFAILYHDGLYGVLKYEIQGNETQLFMILHWADMWASRIVETKQVKESDGEE